MKVIFLLVLFLFLPPIIYGEEREREERERKELPSPDGHFPSVVNIQVTAENSSQSDFCWDCIPPTLGMDKNNKQIVKNGFGFNGNKTNVSDFYTPYPLIETSINQTNTITLKIYENQGIENIWLVQVGLGVQEVGAPINSAEALVEIYFEIFSANIQRVEIKEKYNIIENSSVEIKTQQILCNDKNQLQCLEISMDYRYRESPIFDIVMTSISDKSRNTNNNYFNEGIQVKGESLNPPSIIKINAGLAQNHAYPQDRGHVELTQTDRKNQLWIDIFGYNWQETKQGFKMISEIHYEQKNNDSTLRDAIKIEVQKAQKVLEYYHHMLNQ